MQIQQTVWKLFGFKQKWTDMNGVLGYNSALSSYTGQGTTWGKMNLRYELCPWNSIDHSTYLPFVYRATTVLQMLPKSGITINTNE